jgi:hypothetical protein
MRNSNNTKNKTAGKVQEKTNTPITPSQPSRQPNPTPQKLPITMTHTTLGGIAFILSQA